MANNHMHTDSKKRRSFLALLFAAGDVGRWQIRGKMYGFFNISCKEYRSLQ